MWGAGHRLVAGVDEVGRGAWAGPLSVGVAVLAEPACRIPRGLRDSKQLAETARESIFDAVAAWCAAWAMGHAGPEECDRLGMTAALRLATRRAFDQLPVAFLPDAVVLDGTFDYVSPPAEQTLFDPEDPGRPGPGDPEARGAPDVGLGASSAPHVETVVKADARCASVAAASVLAKVTRDRIMRSRAAWYPPSSSSATRDTPHRRISGPCAATGSAPCTAARGPSSATSPGSSPRGPARTVPDRTPRARRPRPTTPGMRFDGA